MRGAADCDGPAVLVVDGTPVERALALEHLPEHLAIVAGDADAELALGDDADVSLAGISEVHARLRILRAAFRLSEARRSSLRDRLTLIESRQELTGLNRIGMALMMERDPDTLLRQIIQQSVRLTESDAGGLFLLDERDGTARLLFKALHSESVPDVSALYSEAFPLDSTSLAGHVAKTGQPLVLADVHDIPPEAPYALNTMVERRFGIPFKSMLTIPMIDHHDEVVGVLQLANRKSDARARITSREDVERYVVPYTDHEVQLGFSLAGQAAVSIENAQLRAQIERIFESFVRATITAIDQRDPTTAGHSIRVTSLVTDLAGALERTATGPYRSMHFSPAQMRELRYAALLHDCGKLGVREEVLVKARKLPAYLWERVSARFDLIRCAIAFEYERDRAQLLASRTDSEERLAALEARRNEGLVRLDRYRSAIEAANEPTLLPEEAAGILADVAAHTFTLPDGRTEPYLRPDELHYLRIPQGSLDGHERREMESHASQTFLFLSQIPWTDDLKDTAAYAAAHHEWLNGTGYPRRLAGHDIPVQTRMITIADIFDALTAVDRPYKPAVAVDRALDIILTEADAGHVDRDLVNIMIESRVYRRVLETRWEEL
ncbi:MAG: HD-GYP domain-containing protein [Longimicrobiales bacterium]